jgi:protein O-mannosyl-transferase
MNSENSHSNVKISNGRQWLIAAALVVVVLVSYFGAKDCGFLRLDDPQMVKLHPAFQSGLSWEGIVTAFRQPFASLWVPLTTVSFLVDSALWKMDPSALHIENLALHAASVALLFFALTQMTGHVWRSAMVAALFGLHPINVESVAWIAERKSTLCAFFVMLTLLAWSQYARRSSVWMWAAALLSFAMALLAKPMAVPLPCALFLLDFWPLERWKTVPLRRLILEKLPFLVLAFAVSRMALAAAGMGGKIVTLEQLGASDRILNAFVSYAAYLGQLLFPHGFAVLYPHGGQVPWLPSLAAAALLLTITAIAWHLRRTQMWVLIGWLFFLGMVVPSLGLVQVGTQARADRFVYLAQIGIFIAIVWSADLYWPARMRRLQGIFAAAVLIAFASITASQVRVWTNSVTLFEHAISVTGPYPLMLNNAGFAHLEQHNIEAAASYWRRTLEMRPDDPTAQNALSRVQQRRGAKEEAQREDRPPL